MGAGNGIDPALVAEAETLGIDVVAACEAGLAQAIARMRAADMLAQSRDAIAAWNAGVIHDDLPLREDRAD